MLLPAAFLSKRPVTEYLGPGFGVKGRAASGQTVPGPERGMRCGVRASGRPDIRIEKRTPDGSRQPPDGLEAAT
jgi:hypothetical protein